MGEKFILCRNEYSLPVLRIHKGDPSLKFISISNRSPPSNDFIAGCAGIGGMLDRLNGCWSADSIAAIRFSRVLSLENNSMLS